MTATQVIMEVPMKFEVFEILAPCRLVHSYRQFERFESSVESWPVNPQGSVS